MKFATLKALYDKVLSGRASKAEAISFYNELDEEQRASLGFGPQKGYTPEQQAEARKMLEDARGIIMFHPSYDTSFEWKKNARHPEGASILGRLTPAQLKLIAPYASPEQLDILREYGSPSIRGLVPPKAAGAPASASDASSPPPRSVPSVLAGQARDDAAARVASAAATASASPAAPAPALLGRMTPAQMAAAQEAERMSAMYKPLKAAEARYATVSGLEKAASEAAARSAPPAPLPPRRPLAPGPTGETARTGGLPSGVEASAHFGPGWLTGPEGAQRRVVEHAFEKYNEDLAHAPEVYTGDRLADFTEPTVRAGNLLERMLENPNYADMFLEARTGVSKAGDRDTLGEVRPLLASSAASVLPDVAAHMNPYQEAVIRALERRADRRFEEQVLPKITGSYISHGAHGSRAREIAETRARREHEEDLRDKISQVLHHGYETAVGTAERGKGRQLATAREHAALAGSDEARRLEAARTLAALSSEHQGTQRQNVDVLQQLGTQQQGHVQARLNQQYQDWLAKREEPREAFNRLYGYVHRMPPFNTSTISTATGQPPIPHPSPFTTLGGAGLGLVGLLNQGRGAGARGGFAEGGSVSYIPEQIDLMNRMRDQAHHLENSNSHPMWNYLANLGAGIASSRNPRVMGAIGEAIPHAHEGFHQGMQRNETNQMRALAIRQALVDSQLSEREREDKRQQFERNFQLQKLKTMAQIDNLNRRSNDGSSRGLPYTTKTKKDYDKYLQELEEETEKHKGDAELFNRMKENINYLKENSGPFGITEPGGILARTANDPESNFQGLARLAFQGKKREALDQLEKDRNEVVVRESTKKAGPRNVFFEKRVAGSLPSVEISADTGATIASGKEAQATKKHALTTAKKIAFAEIGDRHTSEKIANYVVNKYGISDDAIEHYEEIIDDIRNERKPSYVPPSSEEVAIKESASPPSEGLKGLNSFSKEEKIRYLKSRGLLK